VPELAGAVLAGDPSLLGTTLVAPRAHRDRVTADFGIEEYLALQRLVYRVGEAVRQEVPTERLYIMSMALLRWSEGARAAGRTREVGSPACVDGVIVNQVP